MDLHQVQPSVGSPRDAEGQRRKDAVDAGRAGRRVALLLTFAYALGTTTWMIGRPKTRANSQSRRSCAGTAMMAPVP